MRLFNAGGNFNNGANAGVAYSNGNNNTRSNTNVNIGFRSALPRICQKAQSPRAGVQRKGQRVPFPRR